MIAADAVARLVALLAPLLGLVAGDFSWPGALEIDGRALTALPEPDRPAGVERLVERHGIKAAAPYLLPLLADPEPGVRAYVGRLLARTGDPTALAAAVDWLTTPERPSADRTLGLDLLSHAAVLTPPARRAIELAIRDRDAPVRLRALEAIARHDPLPSLPVLLGALADDSRDVRLQAALVVATVARQHAEAPEAARLATLPLLERLDDADRSIRLAALRALGALRDPRASPALVRIASEPASDLRMTELRTAAVDALGSPALGVGAALTTLVRLSRHRPVDELARHADLALGEIATPAAVAALVAALGTPPVAEEAKLGLLHAGPAAVEALERALAHGTPSSAVLAAALLGEIGDRRATEALTRAITEPATGAAVLRVAMEALEHLRDPAAVPALARAADAPRAAAPRADLRLQAFAALTALADPRSVALLDAGLADPNPRVRASAAQLAGRLAARGSGPALADRLADGDPTVRSAAARALARTGGAPLTRVLPGVAANPAATRAARNPAELEAIGDALEANATAADGPRLAQAFLAAADPGLQGPLARGLAVAHATAPLVNNSAVIDRALALVATGGSSAFAAADLLATAQLSDGEVAALARAFADAEPALRARLCSAIARTPHGGGWLVSLVASSSEPVQVRAAAAWCARGLPDARSALEIAARGPEGPLAANARAALTGGAGRELGGSAIRLCAPDGAPLAGRWVTLAGGGVVVAAMTDPTGVARVDGFSAAIAAGWQAEGLSLQEAPARPTGP